MNGNNVVAIFEVAANGAYTGYMKVSDGYSSTEERESGVVRVRGDILHVFPRGEESIQRRFWFKNGLLWVHFPEIGYKLGFSAMK